MDVFLEQIVAKRNTSVDMLKKAGVILAGILVAFVCMFVLPLVHQIFATFGLILAAAAVYGVYFLLSSMSVEYEYILTNGEIDIDKIIARRKRKRLITVNTRNFTEFGVYKAAEHTGKTYASTIMACSSVDDPNTYYAVMDHAKFGKCILIFNPNEKIIANAKQFMKRNIVKA